jgi:hypothetical protein
MKFYTLSAEQLIRALGLIRFTDRLNLYLKDGRDDVLLHPMFFEENVCSRATTVKDFSLFHRVNTIEEADVIVCPLYLELLAYWLGNNAGAKMAELFRYLETLPKRVVVYWNHDDDFSPVNSIVPKNVIVLNQGHTSSPGPQDILLPFWNVGVFPTLPKVQFASFIGTANNDLRRRLVQAIHSYNRPDIIAATRAYGDNYTKSIAMTLFVLCPRGGPGTGGFSFRVFEAIRAGSIPVLIVDRICYPMTEYIPWDSLCVRIPESKAEDIPFLLSTLQAVDTVPMLKAIEEAIPRLQLEFLQHYIHDRLSSTIARKV